MLRYIFGSVNTLAEQKFCPVMTENEILNTDIFSTKDRNHLKFPLGFYFLTESAKIHPHPSRFGEKTFLMNSQIYELHNDVHKMKTKMAFCGCRWVPI